MALRRRSTVGVDREYGVASNRERRTETTQLVVYSVTWDSRDNRGRQVARGVYFYCLDTPGFRAVKKAVVTR
jgi:hypothetical protein